MPLLGPVSMKPWHHSNGCDAGRGNLPSAIALRYPRLSFKKDSIHSFKSKEADYVILLHLGKGKSGLPSEIVTHPLIEALQAKAEPFLMQRSAGCSTSR